MAKAKKVSSLKEKPKEKTRKNSRKIEKIIDFPEFTSNSTYTDQGFSHQLLKIAKKISNFSFPFSLKIPLPLVLSAFKQLALNEIEASLFSIFLEKFSLKDQNLSLSDQVLFTGLLAKSKLTRSSDSISALKSKLSTKNSKFSENFSKFEEKTLPLAFADALEINERYSSLSENDRDEVMEVEYNQLVDEILKTSVPYNTDHREAKDLKNPEKRRNLKKPLKKFDYDRHMSLSQYPIRRPSANNATFPLFPSDSSMFFPPTVMERGESLCSDLLNLSRGPSSTDHLKKNLEVISSRRSSDSHSRGFFLKD